MIKQSIVATETTNWYFINVELNFVYFFVSGSIRSSCHKMPDQCHDRPCMHGGNCTEGWNRYICDCSQTGFSGPACGNGNFYILFIVFSVFLSICVHKHNLSLLFHNFEHEITSHLTPASIPQKILSLTTSMGMFSKSVKTTGEL